MNFKELEQIRQNYLAKHKKIQKTTLMILIPIYAVIVAIILIQVLAASQGDSMSFVFNIIPLIQPLFFFVIIYFVIITLCTHKELSAYKKAYKAYFVAQSFAKIFTNINYDHTAAMPQNNIVQVMTTGDRYSSNDYMTATYKNINFSQADVHTESEYTDSDGDTHYSTIFRGRFLIFDFNRNFDFALQIRSTSFPGAILPRNAKSGLKFHKLETESTDFNQDFKIYGQDGVDTFYILDPAFMEKIHNLYHTLNNAFAITFLDGKIYIAVNNHQDAFEAPSPKKPIDEKTEIEKISKDIKAITNFVDSLDLDQYTYKRNKK